MSEPRQNKVLIAIGGRGTGKTTRLKKISDAHTAKKVLIYDTDNNKKWDYPTLSVDELSSWHKGKYKLIDTDSETVLDAINAYINDTLLFVEDATKYIGNVIPKTLKSFLLATKQRNVDVILTFHSFRRITPDLFNFANGLIIFKTGENIHQFRSKIPNFELVQKTQNEVDKHPSRYFNKTIIIN